MDLNIKWLLLVNLRRVHSEIRKLQACEIFSMVTTATLCIPGFPGVARPATGFPPLFFCAVL